MAEKPIMHGRDHRPGGYDPIPGLAGPSWVHLHDINISVTSGLGHTHYTFDAATVYTNASSLFSVVPSFGLHIDGPGFYVATVSCYWTSDTVGSAEMVCNLAPEDNGLFDQDVFTKPGFAAGSAVTQATQGFILDAGTSPTADLILRQSSGITATVSMEMTVVQLTTDIGDY